MPARSAMARVVTASTPPSSIRTAAASRIRSTVSRLRAWTGCLRRRPGSAGSGSAPGGSVGSGELGTASMG